MTTTRFVDPYTWYNDFVRHAWMTANEVHQRIGQLYRAVQSSNDTGTVVNLCDEGVRLARSLNQPYWDAFFRLRRISAQQPLDHAQYSDEIIRLSVDISKPEYADCPLIARVYATLIEYYIRVDPLGYASDILEGVEYVEQYLPLDRDTFIWMAGWKLQVYMAQRQWQLAYETSQIYLDRAQEHGGDYYVAHAAIFCTRLYYELGAPHAALKINQLGERAGINCQAPMIVKSLLVWRIAILHRLGQTEQARELNWQINQKYPQQGSDYRVLYATTAYGTARQRLLQCHRAIEAANRFNDLNMELDMRVAYYALLKQTPMWARWFHWSWRLSRMRQIQKLLTIVASLPDLLRLVIYPVLYLVGFTILLIVGAVLQLFTRPLRQEYLALQRSLDDSPAADIYRARLIRINAGDFTLLS